MNREELIAEYYQVTPRDCADLIDLDYEKKRINKISLEELKKEIDFYRELNSWR